MNILIGIKVLGYLGLVANNVAIIFYNSIIKGPL